MNLLEFDETCRLCLSKDKLVNIFDDNSNYSELIQEITKLKIVLDDGYPNKICTQCCIDLEYLNQFKLKCIKTDNVLKEIFNSETLNLKENQQSEKSKQTFSPLLKNICKRKKIKPKTYLSSVNDLKYINRDELNCEIKKEDCCNNDVIILNNQNSSESQIINSNKISQLNKTKLKSLTPCHICGKFYELCKIQYHINAHNNIRPFICNVEKCTKSFTSPFQLNSHKKLCHTDFYRFKCDICGKQFKIKTTFDIHKSYHGEPQLPCGICGKLLRNKRAVKKHMMSHTGERPYPCNECDKSFANRYNLKVHTRVHTKEKPFVCNCGEAFGYNCLLKTHIERYHPEVIDV